MKKIFSICFKNMPFKGLGLALLLATVVSSCDKDFDDLNINQTAATAINPVFILNSATINSSFTTGSVLYEMGIVQQVVSPNSLQFRTVC